MVRLHYEKCSKKSVVHLKNERMQFTREDQGEDRKQIQALKVDHTLRYHLSQRSEIYQMARQK